MQEINRSNLSEYSKADVIEIQKLFDILDKRSDGRSKGRIKVEPKQKKAWEMTFNEYQKFRPLYTPTTAKNYHRNEVRDALYEGKSVPENVLADYPELKPEKKPWELTQAKESELNKIFKHHAWFVGEKKTKKEAMDYFAKSGDFWLSAKPSKEQSDNLLDPMNYDDILKSEKQSYKLNQIEKEYFLERKEYWKGETEKQNKEFLSESINVDEEFKKDLSGNSYVSDRDYNKAKENYSEL